MDKDRPWRGGKCLPSPGHTPWGSSRPCRPRTFEHTDKLELRLRSAGLGLPEKMRGQGLEGGAPEEEPEELPTPDPGRKK